MTKYKPTSEKAISAKLEIGISLDSKDLLRP